MLRMWMPDSCGCVTLLGLLAKGVGIKDNQGSRKTSTSRQQLLI
jgi:hypothetical protein